MYLDPVPSAKEPEAQAAERGWPFTESDEPFIEPDWALIEPDRPVIEQGWSLSEQALAAEEQESIRPRRPPRKPWTARLGLIALTLAITTLALEAAAISLGAAGLWASATILAWCVIGLFALSLLSGLVAVVVGWGRRPGTVAVLLSVLANPLLLVWLFGLARGLG